MYMYMFLISAIGSEPGMCDKTKYESGMYVSHRVCRIGMGISKDEQMHEPWDFDIMLTCPCYLHPLTLHFYIVKLEFTGVYIFFIFAPKH